MLLEKLTKGFLGLTSSRKGVLSMMLFFCALAPMTVLCFLGKLDGTSYAACMSAITVAVVAVFCHTQSQTDQILNAPPTISSVVSTVETAIKSGPPENLPPAQP